MAGINHSGGRLVDTDLELKAAGVVAADTAHTAKDLGAAGEVLAELIINTTAVEIATGDEQYEIVVQCSSSATFASDVANILSVRIGDASTIATELGASAACDLDDGATAEIRVPVCNSRNGVVYRYMRLYTRVVGTIATGINYSARLSELGSKNVA